MFQQLTTGSKKSWYGKTKKSWQSSLLSSSKKQTEQRFIGKIGKIRGKTKKMLSSRCGIFVVVSFLKADILLFKFKNTVLIQ